MRRRRSVVLVGLMATGKSTVGRILAKRLDLPLVDSDAEIERATGRTVRDIWLADGEAAFRTLERDALRSTLDDDRPAVIAAAGGVVLDPANREALISSDAVVVWLDAEPDVLAERAVRSGHRPLLDDDPLGVLTQMAHDRAHLYAEVADHRVDIDGRTAVDVADLVEDLL